MSQGFGTTLGSVNDNRMLIFALTTFFRLHGSQRDSENTSQVNKREGEGELWKAGLNTGITAAICSHVLCYQ